MNFLAGFFGQAAGLASRRRPGLKSLGTQPEQASPPSSAHEASGGSFDAFSTLATAAAGSSAKRRRLSAPEAAAAAPPPSCEARLPSMLLRGGHKLCTGVCRTGPCAVPCEAAGAPVPDHPVAPAACLTYSTATLPLLVAWHCRMQGTPSPVFGYDGQIGAGDQSEEAGNWPASDENTPLCINTLAAGSQDEFSGASSCCHHDVALAVRSCSNLWSPGIHMRLHAASASAWCIAQHPHGRDPCHDDCVLLRPSPFLHVCLQSSPARRRRLAPAAAC